MVAMKKRTLKLALVIIVAALAYLAFHFHGEKSGVYSSEGGLFRYSESRPAPAAQIMSSNITENYTISELALESRDAVLSSYLFVPKAEPKAGVVLVAGAGVDKNGNLGLAKMLANEGLEVLSYDQRSTGKTVVENIRNEPESHKSIYDSLAAFDYLREQKGIGRVVIAGESLGGRTAILAGSMDGRLAGVLAISTSGYGPVSDPDYYSINPDNYLALFGGKKVAFIHSTADQVIPIGLASQTFGKAQPPKRFFRIDGCTHGYCGEMKPQVLEALGWILGSN